tara:strand:+ start:3184 stop:3519 length:336 start_codon:yes stop_codon:yes gene_type:complete
MAKVEKKAVKKVKAPVAKTKTPERSPLVTWDSVLEALRKLVGHERFRRYQYRVRNKESIIEILQNDNSNHAGTFYKPMAAKSGHIVITDSRFRGLVFEHNKILWEFINENS